MFKKLLNKSGSPNLQPKMKGATDDSKILIIKNAEFTEDYIPVRFINPKHLDMIKDAKAGTYVVLGFENLEIGGTLSLSEGVDCPLRQYESSAARRIFAVYQVKMEPVKRCKMLGSYKIP